RAARYLLPGFEVGEIQETWAGLRSLTPDGLPLIGRTGRISNLVVATGHAMLGVTQSVVTGRLVADLVVGNQPEVPLESFSPDRF
ncbi:MAG: FAD-binding oxidoreductase, partial [Planctomycetaceae bacterium]